VLHHLVIEANHRIPIAMPSAIGIVSILFVGALLAWMAALLVHFAKRNPA
jgi:hypothetical protein